MKGTGVDVWCLRFSAGVPCRKLADFLSPEERTRAAAFHAESHREKFEIARGALRLLLGRYLREDPAGIEFEYGNHGKPYVNRDLRFNIAHSGDLALYALSHLEVGIDIEQMRPLPDLMNIARRFFSAAEATEIASLPAKDRPEAFHCCWARKEAYVKALGVGLSLPLESFRVSVLPDEPAGIKEIRGHPGQESEWLLKDLAVAENYAAALAVRAPEISLWISPVFRADELADAIGARDI